MEQTLDLGSDSSSSNDDSILIDEVDVDFSSTRQSSASSVSSRPDENTENDWHPFRPDDQTQFSMKTAAQNQETRANLITVSQIPAAKRSHPLCEAALIAFSVFFGGLGTKTNFVCNEKSVNDKFVDIFPLLKGWWNALQPETQANLATMAGAAGGLSNGTMITLALLDVRANAHLLWQALRRCDWYSLLYLLNAGSAGVNSFSAAVAAGEQFYPEDLTGATIAFTASTIENGPLNCLFSMGALQNKDIRLVTTLAFLLSGMNQGEQKDIFYRHVGWLLGELERIESNQVVVTNALKECLTALQKNYPTSFDDDIHFITAVDILNKLPDNFQIMLWTNIAIELAVYKPTCLQNTINLATRMAKIGALVIATPYTLSSVGSLFMEIFGKNAVGYGIGGVMGAIAWYASVKMFSQGVGLYGTYLENFPAILRRQYNSTWQQNVLCTLPSALMYIIGPGSIFCSTFANAVMLRWVLSFFPTTLDEGVADILVTVFDALYAVLPYTVNVTYFNKGLADFVNGIISNIAYRLIEAHKKEQEKTSIVVNEASDSDTEVQTSWLDRMLYEYKGLFQFTTRQIRQDAMGNAVTALGSRTLGLGIWDEKRAENLRNFKLAEEDAKTVTPGKRDNRTGLRFRLLPPPAGTETAINISESNEQQALLGDNKQTDWSPCCTIL